MKNNKLILALLALSMQTGPLMAQKKIRDKHITNQQERMVFKQWDRGKFTPTSGFLGLNPDYLITWFLHPNYPKTDLRPLGPRGMQTQRLGLVLAMQQTAEVYKLQSDTLGDVARGEVFNYTPATAAIDPLWLLYYKAEFEPLLDPEPGAAFAGASAEVMAYLQRSGLQAWYAEQTDLLRDRLLGVMNASLDRGSRIIVYHRLLGDYRQLQTSWETKKQKAAQYLNLSRRSSQLSSGQTLIRTDGGHQTDKEIADQILRHSKF